MIRKWWNASAAKDAIDQYSGKLSLRTAEYLAGRARIHCPVDTGFLLNSIEIISSKAGATWHVIATAAYAVPVEMGHMTLAGSWVPPQPFMRMALADTKQAFPNLAQSIRLVSPHGDGGVSHLGVSDAA